jgi:glycerol-3-phosphate dehydrogenase (NAD(P)+)
MEKKQILILGYGEMGHAFEALLQGRQPYTIWTRRGETGTTGDLAAAAASAGFVVFCLPVVAHEAVARQLADCLPQNGVCVSIAKGLDEEGRPAEAILRATLPAHPHALMYGPMISEEIRAGRPGFAQLGTRSQADYDAVAALFSGSHLSLQRSEDIVGISWAVILKNVYAILFGVADEMGLGDNMRGHLMVTALQELSRIVVGKGGNADTPFGLAGLGDLTTTATSEASHHHSLGRCLAGNYCETVSGEGVHTLQMVERHGLVNTAEYPLFALAQGIIQHQGQTAALMQAYLQGLQES